MRGLGNLRVKTCVNFRGRSGKRYHGDEREDQHGCAHLREQ